MKHTIKFYAMLACLGGLAVLYACSDDDSGDSTFAISSLMAGSKDLNGATSATEVPVTTALTATFSSDVDESTATSSNIILKRNFDGAVVATDIEVSGRTITITPMDDLSGGVQYLLSVGAGLKSTGGVAFGAQERSFTTIGTFAPDNAIAHWTFENSANDVVGSYDAAMSDIVDIAYVDSRNTNAGKAASFNGTTSIIEIANGPSLVNTTDFSLSIWVKPDSAAHHGGNYVLGVSAFNGFQFEINKNNAKLATQYDLGNGETSAEDTWIDGTGDLGWQGWTFSKNYGTDGFAALVQQKWTHFVFTYTSATKIGSAYINGELAKSFDFKKWPTGDVKQGVTGLKYKEQDNVGDKLALGFINDRSSTAFDFGLYGDPTKNHYKGLMDDVRIYHKAITAKEIEVMYNSEKP